MQQCNRDRLAETWAQDKLAGSRSVGPMSSLFSVDQQCGEGIRTNYSETGGIEFGRAVGFVAGGIGDQIYHLTQLRSLAGACQTGTIDIACIHPGPTSRILAATPWVGRIIDARPIRRYVPGLRGSDTVRALRLHKYDTAFFMHRSTSFKLASAFAGIPSRIGLSDGWVDKLLLSEALPLENGGNRRSVWGHRPFIAAIDEFILNNGLHLDLKTPTISPDRSARELTYKWMSQGKAPCLSSICSRLTKKTMARRCCGYNDCHYCHPSRRNVYFKCRP